MLSVPYKYAEILVVYSFHISCMQNQLLGMCMQDLMQSVAIMHVIITKV